ncbi:MAG TPA: PepSY-associated TM helix domain-containing protein [Stellaceae bacterium]|nr:PepSY-associated TM helix domain-containing protein [Stellaceae bacterium]
MTRTQVRAWFLVHRWTSLVCTVFLLVVCVTGLPLIFGDEIDHWLDGDPPYANLPNDAPRASLDELVAIGRRLHPGEIATSLFIDDDEPQVVLSMAPSWEALRNDPASERWIKFDGRTARLLKQSLPQAERRRGFIDVMLTLHRELFVGLPGELFLGGMGLLFVAAIVSGTALYAPFMRKQAFGTVRRQRSTRLRWLDLHNLLGVVTLAWGLAIGATGVMNELSQPLFALWNRTEVQALLDPWRHQAPAAQGELSSVQAAFEAAGRVLPGMRVVSVVFPGADDGSPYHYLFWAKGGTPLTGRLFTPVLVDARSGKLTGAVRMPWYLRALEVSRPLHFGDYGGLPLKIIWALLDLATIAVLGSGLYLWLSRRKSPVEALIAEIERGGAEPAAAAPEAAE